MDSKDLLLDVKDLHIFFFTDEGCCKSRQWHRPENHRGRTLCLVGESGCGKSVACRAFLNIIRSPGAL
jgi:peptide/nickel transport system ATP-binding protein